MHHYGVTYEVQRKHRREASIAPLDTKYLMMRLSRSASQPTVLAISLSGLAPSLPIASATSSLAAAPMSMLMVRLMILSIMTIMVGLPAGGPGGGAASAAPFSPLVAGAAAAGGVAAGLMSVGAGLLSFGALQCGIQCQQAAVRMHDDGSYCADL